MLPGRIIDAHQHLWDFARADYPWLQPTDTVLYRRFDIGDLHAQIAPLPVTHTVLVQAADNADDTAYMFEVASQHETIAGVVGWVPLDRPEVADAQLTQLRKQPKFVGIRNLIHDQPDPDWLLRADVNDGLVLLADADVPFDVVSVLPRHLEHVPVLAEHHPGLRMVLDHLSKPPIKSDSWEPWKSLIARAAESPNVYAKVSGLYPAVGDPSSWSVNDIQPFVEYAIEIFGVERLMFGSDWPVAEIAGGYRAVWDGIVTAVAHLDDPARDQLFSLTAQRFYGLGND